MKEKNDYVHNEASGYGSIQATVIEQDEPVLYNHKGQKITRDKIVGFNTNLRGEKKND